MNPYKQTLFAQPKLGASLGGLGTYQFRLRIDDMVGPLAIGGSPLVRKLWTPLGVQAIDMVRLTIRSLNERDRA